MPTRSEAVLVDPVTSLTTEVALPARYQSLSLVTDIAGGGAGAAVDVALLWNGGAATDGVAFWELGQTAGRPYRSIETVGVVAAVAAVLPVPQHPNLRVLQTASASEFYVLDLQTRTAAPLVTSTSSIALSMSPVGDQVWTFTPGGPLVVATGILDTHPRSLLIERTRAPGVRGGQRGRPLRGDPARGRRRRRDGLRRQHARRRHAPAVLERAHGRSLPMKRRRCPIQWV